MGTKVTRPIYQASRLQRDQGPIHAAGFPPLGYGGRHRPGQHVPGIINPTYPMHILNKS